MDPGGGAPGLKRGSGSSVIPECAFRIKVTNWLGVGGGAREASKRLATLIMAAGKAWDEVRNS